MSGSNNGNLNSVARLRDITKGSTLCVLDLFAGCGGLSLGFQHAGFNIVGSVERDPKAALSHGKNFFKNKSETEIELHSQPLDITQIGPEKYMREILKQDNPSGLVDVIMGGPPCQAFARIGRAKLRQIADHPEAYLNDNRASLYLHFLEYVDFFHPLAVLIENVPDILNYGGKNVAEEIASSLEDLGYRVRYTLLNAVNYRVPQFRLRFFLIAYLNGLNILPEFPEPTHQTHIPAGYTWERMVALKNLPPHQKDFFYDRVRYVEPPRAPDNLPEASTAKQAIGDLPKLTGHLSSPKKRGVRNFNQTLPYRNGRPCGYASLMRIWPGYEAGEGIVDHVIRFLPRDYEIFHRMEPDDQYPEAHIIAMSLFDERLKEIESDTGINIPVTSKEYEALRKQLVPPYKVDIFPNKWWKINPDLPVRTLTAHIGKDTYTHIHYDSDQARVISVREAARLQSFPDGFTFVGPMNVAFQQIGNSVPPLMAFALAEKMLHQLQQAASQPPPELLSWENINQKCHQELIKVTATNGQSDGK